jgi:hypothetical protein
MKRSNADGSHMQPVVVLNRIKYDSQSDPTDHPAFKRFSQLLEEVLDSYEQDLEQMSVNRRAIARGEGGGLDDEEIPPEYLLNRQLCGDMAQEAFKLNAYSIMDSVKKESLVKLQNLLYYNIKDGFRALHLMQNDV